MRKHYVHTKRRGDLWVAHRVDRDRTTERIELGVRASDALRGIVGSSGAFSRR